MSRFGPLAFLMVFAFSSVKADEAIQVPAEIKAKVGKFISIEPMTTSEVVLWEVSDESVATLPKGDKGITAISFTPGRYVLTCWGAIDNKPTRLYRVTLIVEGAAPPVPPPQPNPSSDTFAEQIQAAYSADPSPEKADNRDLLTELYRALATESASEANKTLGDLNAKHQGSVKRLLPGDELKSVRQIVAKQLVALVGTDPTRSLDEAGIRSKVITHYKKAAKAVEGCK